MSFSWRFLRAVGDHCATQSRGAGLSWHIRWGKAWHILRQPSPLNKAWVGMLGIALVGWSSGLVMFLTAPRPFAATLPGQQIHPRERHNLAAAAYGPSVRVSSFYSDTFSHHHPIFLVDGRRDPTLVEKWASAVGDQSPWVEIRWRGTHTIGSVKIHHAGTVETSDYTSRDYAITCLLEAGVGPRLKITGNEANLAEHDFECADAAGLRVDFVPRSAGEQTRIFEIEAWGQ